MCLQADLHKNFILFAQVRRPSASNAAASSRQAGLKTLSPRFLDPGSWSEIRFGKSTLTPGFTGFN